MPFPRAFLAAILVAPILTGAATGAWASEPAPFNQTVERRIQPPAERLLDRLATEGRTLAIDGAPVFNGADKFLPGKIALGLTDSIANLADGDPRLAQRLAEFRQTAKLTVDDPNDSWGIYYYLSALNALNARGRLKAAVDPLTLAKLRVRLDWRSFVDVDSYELIDHPNNYYGVAFAIARLRHQLGWESAEGSERLLAPMLAHYREFSGAYGFADETDGEGRFDRYSVLLAGEIAQRFMETGGRPPPEVLGWLRKSADVMLMRLNPAGEGFEYGRSLGPYSETAIVEVLTAAAVLEVLTPQEKALAYGYASRAAQRYADFWLDPRTGSVNLWDGGRRTDDYRGKFRILGENLSLAHQFAYTAAAWNRMGFKDKAPDPGFDAALARLPAHAVTWFARGEYDRLLVTLRDGGRVIGLPLISGGASQHMNSPYFPIPYSPGMLSGVADEPVPQLVARFTLADGAVLMPLAYFKDARVTQAGRRTTLAYRLPQMDRLGEESPRPDPRLSAVTTYTLEPGRIVRRDVFTPRGGLDLKDVTLQFASYSGLPIAKGAAFRYAGPGVRTFAAQGFESCSAASAEGARADQTPTGVFASVVTCRIGPRKLQAPLTLTWTLTYQ